MPWAELTEMRVRQHLEFQAFRRPSDVGSAVESGTPYQGSRGDNTGNIAANSRDVTMNAKTVKGVNMSDVVIFARALRQSTPMLGLPDEEASELVELADRIEQEASGEAPDLNRLQRWGANVLGLLNSPVVSGALGGVLAAYGGTVLPGLQSGP
jgi:hypothetical protein